MTIIIIVSVSVLVLIAIAIATYFIFIRHKVKIIGNGFTINTIDSGMSTITPNKFIVHPKVNNGFTLHFGLQIDNFYLNHLRWKHVFHKGTYKTDIYDYRYWYNIESELPKQALGVWLHPDKPAMRIAISTLKKYNYQHSDYPTPEELRTRLRKNEHKEIIEICDIEDIEPNTLNYYTIVVEGHSISVYKNAKLIKTSNLVGEVMLNMGDMYFNYHKTYGGKLKNFTYLPKSLNPSKVAELYNYFF